MQKVKVQKWLPLKEKMKVVDEVKRAKPVMDVAAEFGVVLCYYSRPCKQLVLHNDMDVCYPHKSLNCCFRVIRKTIVPP